MTFTRGPDGAITVDHWDDEIEVSGNLLALMDPAFCRFDGERLVLSPVNGTATYVLTGTDEAMDLLRFDRLYGDLKPPAQL